jgi:hypothetical protein
MPATCYAVLIATWSPLTNPAEKGIDRIITIVRLGKVDSTGRFAPEEFDQHVDDRFAGNIVLSR